MRRFWFFGSASLALAAALIGPPNRSSTDWLLALVFVVVAVVCALFDRRSISSQFPRRQGYRALGRGRNLVLAAGGLVIFSFCLLNVGMFYGLRWERFAILRSPDSTPNIVTATVTERRLRFKKSPRLTVSVKYRAPGADQDSVKSFELMYVDYAKLDPGDRLRVILPYGSHARVRPADIDLDEAVVPIAFAWAGVIGMLSVLVWGILRVEASQKKLAK